jgi:hypothetical protein
VALTSVPLGAAWALDQNRSQVPIPTSSTTAAVMAAVPVSPTKLWAPKTAVTRVATAATPADMPLAAPMYS